MNSKSTNLDVIDFVLVYNRENKNKEQRQKYLHNLLVNGLDIEIKVEENFKLLFLFIRDDQNLTFLPLSSSGKYRFEEEEASKYGYVTC